MSHDIEDLLAIIKGLEERIIVLERSLSSNVTVNPDNDWYWNH